MLGVVLVEGLYLCAGALDHCIGKRTCSFLACLLSTKQQVSTTATIASAGLSTG